MQVHLNFKKTVFCFMKIFGEIWQKNWEISYLPSGNTDYVQKGFFKSHRKRGLLLRIT
jgi:hypothetical protein